MLFSNQGKILDTYVATLATGLVGLLAQWLELNLVLGCRMTPGEGKEVAVQTCVQRCC